MAIERREGYHLWEGGPVPKGADGITLCSLVIVRRGHATPYLLRHELVHVRRHDPLVNLVQAAAEIALFHHPAAWWVSRSVVGDVMGDRHRGGAAR